MRRGLLSWDKEEAPVVALEARVARCQSAISDAGLGCLVVYTNFPRPSAVSWLKCKRPLSTLRRTRSSSPGS